MSIHPWKPRDNIAGITQIIDSFIRSNKASWCNIDACLSVSLSALEEPVLQKSGRVIRQKGRRGLSIHEETRKVGVKKVCERKGVTECNDNARFMQPCTAEELANAARNFFSFVLLFSLSLSIPPSPLPSASSRCVAAAVMQLQSGVSLGERKLRELHCAHARSFVPPKFIREDASVPPRKLRSCRRAARGLLSPVKGRRNRGDREVTKVDVGQITDR